MAALRGDICFRYLKQFFLVYHLKQFFLVYPDFVCCFETNFLNLMSFSVTT